MQGTKVHPRTHGADRKIEEFKEDGFGSSPYARGGYLQKKRKGKCIRFIPVRTGRILNFSRKFP